MSLAPDHRAMDVRVRLVFADDVGRHLQRRRGFASCWYLLPKDAKLVGDLAHALLQEFELRKVCPEGVELLVEELPVLATQSIRIVRDNDTISVQCPRVTERVGSECGTSDEDSGNGVESLKRKRTTTEKKRKKKVKTKDGKKIFNDEQQGIPKRRNVGGAKASTLLKSNTFTASSEENSSCSSSSCSSSTSGSSSSENEADGDVVAQRNHPRLVQKATKHRQERDKLKSVATTGNAVSNGVPNKMKITSKQSEKAPRRRRRRLRQRNGARQRNQTRDGHANSGLSPGNASHGRDVAATAPQQPRLTLSRENQHGGYVRGYPRAKKHVYFDPVTGDGVDVTHHELQNDARANGSMKHPQALNLSKYGPSRGHLSRVARSHENGVVSSTGELANGDEKACTSNESFEGKEKWKYEERWKRPYQIVATVLDNKSEKASNTTLETENEVVTKLLDSYPTAPIVMSQFVPRDIIAYKTLTLCLETWQPVLSEWQCGEVQSTHVSGDSIEVSVCMLEATGDSITFTQDSNAERQSIQVNDISECRFLAGPSWSSLQNSKRSASPATAVEAME
ncbi:hypothetical protein PsorP6_001953 [Peronosclerospora sorghi]|uniref:Uncharacterized protein n=1 Tax=Peronosclerospora sorghi TaxID=230839 RepID=A0ACC0WW77_9STRA|nr:hypothetical protein PsorP6_001953 [Peronosclerospora sorghi]